MELVSYIGPEEDVLLLNQTYVPALDQGNGKFSDDVLYLTFRDNKTGEKVLREISKPKTETFITKPEYRATFKTQRLFLEQDKVDSYLVRYNQLASFVMKTIQEDGRDLEYLQVCKLAKKEAFKWRNSYFADYHICDYAVMSYMLNRTIDETKLSITKSFFDIESDIYGISTVEADEGMAPINAISFVIPFSPLGVEYEHPKVFTFLLRNHTRYKEQKFFEENIEMFLQECHDEFDDKYNTPEFHIRLYDNELDLLKMTFGVLHKFRPDFILIWNMSYDIPAIMKRLQYLGEDPRSYFCHPDFKTPYIKYNYDRIYKNDFKNKTESFDCTSYSTWVDQMLNYAGVRKASKDYGPNTLDNVAHIELDAEKRRFDKKTTSVINASIEEYWNFVKYSINDVLLQYGIDKRTGDMQSLFEQALYGATRLSKALKQSVYLKNVFAYAYFKDYDIVPKNNDNVSYINNRSEEDAVDRDILASLTSSDGEIDMERYDEISLPGAVVGDPTLNDNCGATILGKRSNAYYIWVMDMDYSSMYPNIKISSNIGPHTQHGRLILEKQLIKDENPDNNPKFIRAGKFIEDLETCDGWKVGTWMNLPSSYDLIKDYSEFRKGSINYYENVKIHEFNEKTKFVKPEFINGLTRIKRSGSICN